MRKQKLFLAACALLLSAVTWAQATWTDKTSLITNPSFETDEAVSNATTNALNSATVTGWTVLPKTSVSNAQAAVANSSSTLSILSPSDGATTGSKFFYVRQNWNNSGNFGIEQTLPSENLPEGLYLLTVKIKTSSSSPDKTKWYLSLQEEGKEAVIDSRAGSASEWLSNGVLLYKESSSTTLTISAYMVAGASGGSQHYAMLLDDFELKYISPSDLGTLNSDNTLDLSGVIYNAGIYNANKAVMPRGWTAYKSTRGNSNFTEGTGDTQLEGWSGGTMDIDYYQAQTNLPAGKYTVTAWAHDSNDQGAVVYGWCADGSGEGDMSTEYADVTTSAFNVLNGGLNIGIKHNGGASWVTGDNFRLTYFGIKPIYDEALLAATTARDNSDYAGVLGKEKADLLAAIALVPSNYNEYKTAVNALNTATAAFTAAKDTYAACVTEYAHYVELSGATDYADFITTSTTGTDVLNAIKEAEYVAVTTKYDTDGSALFIPSWDVSNFDALNSQHWSGQTSTYYDKWNGGAFNCSISKTVTLPQGHYAFYAAGRGQANSASAVTLKVAIDGGSTLTQAYTMKGDTGKGIDISGAANFGEGTFANNNVGRGWEWRYIVFELAEETNVTLSIEGNGSNSWVSACDTKLLTYENVEVSRRLYNASMSAATAARDNSDYDNVQGAERATLVSTINDDSFEKSYTGYRDQSVALDNATSAFIAAKANWDALASEIANATSLGASTTAAVATRDNVSTTSAGALAATQALKVTEYNYVTDTYQYGVELGTWTATGGTGSLSSQHWSGEKREYLEQSSENWAKDSWTIKYAQDVALPAGSYVFKVAGRQAASDGVTLSLTVKNGEEVLGTVGGFPRGDRGLGINTAGATSFDPNDTFCNTRNNNGDNLQTNGGNGWEWRYVKFTIAEDATVNVAVDAVATEKYMWVSFCDATVQTDNEAKVLLIAYNIALSSAIAARDDAANRYVGGTDKSNLIDAINADGTLDKTDADAINAATEALNAARTTFLAGVADWNAYTIAKNTTYTDDQPYASADKFAAIATAKGGDAPNTASEAAAKTAAIKSAYRKYIESNALAEGVAGAEDKTSLISDPNMEVTYDGSTHTFGAWQVFSQVDGNIQLLSGESFTDGDGKNDYKYADIYKSDNNAGIQQTINLDPGHYMLTVTARAQNTAGASFKVFAGSETADIQRIGNSGGVFDRGWNDASVEFYVPENSDVNIGVQSGNGKNLWWSATRFRLVRLGDAVENVNVTAAGYATFYSKYALDFTGTGLTAYVASIGESKVSFSEVSVIPANTGVLLKGDEGSYNIAMAASADAVENIFEGVLEATEKEAGIFVLMNGAEGVGFYKTKNTFTVGAHTAYLPASIAGGEARSFIGFDFGETTAVDGIVASDGNSKAVYNLNGQRVITPKRGLYIVNGKKVMMK